MTASEFGIALGLSDTGSTVGVSDEVDVVIEAEFSEPPLTSAAGSSAVAPGT